VLWTLLLILVVLWALGFATATAGNLIHVLLVIALIMLVLQLLGGGRTV
jgi:hypothetical protein